MRKGLKLKTQGIRFSGEIILSCIHCEKSYDLREATRNSSKKRLREVRCPHCNKIVGT